MKLRELKEAVDKAVAEGHGEVDVVFDAEARQFHAHYINIDYALEFDTFLGESADKPLFLFGMFTRHH